MAKVKRERLNDHHEDALITQQQAHGPACKYDPLEHPRQAQAMAKLGATQTDVADAFGVTTRTVQLWCAKFPELRDALDAGNAVFDSRVERALAERAIGFWESWEEEARPSCYWTEVKKKYFRPIPRLAFSRPPIACRIDGVTLPAREQDQEGYQRHVE
jgi:hypothetical protein